MYGDLHLGHLSVNGWSLNPHSPQIAMFRIGLKEFVSSAVFSIDFLISAAFASLGICRLTDRPPLSNFDSLLHSVISSLLFVKSAISSDFRIIP